MRDLFDDFMKELAERQRQAQAAARGERIPPSGDPSGDANPGDDAGTTDAVDGPPAVEEDPVAADRPDRGPTSDTDDEPPPPLRPRPLPGSHRGPPPGLPPRRRGPGGPNDGGSRRRRLRDLGPQVVLGVVALILLSAIFLVGIGLELVTDATWFKSVGFDPVFWTRIGSQAGLFVLGLVVALLFLLVNIWLAGRLAPPPGTGAGDRFRAFVDRLGQSARTTGESQFRNRYDPFGQARRGPFGSDDDSRPGGVRPVGPSLTTADLPDLRPLGVIVLVILAVLVALGTAGALSGNWETVALFANRVPFATAGAAPVVDPVFGRDISFYFFDLPFLRLLQATAGGLLLAALLFALARYVVAALGGSGFTTPVRVHLGVLAGLYLITVAAGYQLDKLELVYSTRGVATGVSYTDQAAQFFALDALTIVAGIVAALLVAGAFTRWVAPLGAGVAIWLGLSLLLGTIYPEAIQRFTVEPNQYAQEQPYIANNIAMTRLAYNLGPWQDQTYSGAVPLTADALVTDASTFQNARLWDYRPLQTTLDQIQTVRQYYQFVDVDTDRYVIGGQDRQVMLSARELAPERNPQGGSWVNQRIVFTHGFGIAMVPVNEVDSQGLPQLIIRDMPPVASAGAPNVTEPRIYFGERPNDWVIVDGRQPEFDYPIGTGDQASPTDLTQTRWQATTGIKLDSILTRLLFAARFRDLNLLISDQVTADSQLLMNRSLGERLQLIAPFLAYDKDPYLVVTGAGRLVYVQDAYTITNRFPNAETFDGDTLGQTSGLAGQSFNYMRNSVKVVMDAYDGSMTFYVADPADPLIRAWQGVFPTLFKPLATMPADIQAHLRVPEELFNVQTQTFARYHVTDPASFYQGDDLWTVPQNQANSATGQLPLEAYYVYMRMPGQPKPEFLLLQPMVPKARPNMIAWVAARNDAPNYGAVKVFRFPRDTSIFGPAQIEARIDQEPAISSQLTLWSQAGSTVVRGNLIVVPVQDSIIYLEPIYLQSTGSAIPEFTKIVVASPTKIVWGDTLSEALSALLSGTGSTPSPSPTPGGPSPSPGVSPTPGASATPVPSGGPDVTPRPDDVKALVSYANTHFELAQAALRAGDFATYGVEIAKVQATLRQLGVVVVPSPTPAP
ncbi:MAG TPA: UPF0182 family protein [Candidatus Limnocylindrales bacterium]